MIFLNEKMAENFGIFERSFLAQIDEFLHSLFSFGHTSTRSRDYHRKNAKNFARKTPKIRSKSQIFANFRNSTKSFKFIFSRIKIQKKTFRQDLVEMYPNLKRESKNSSIATRTNLSKIAIFSLKIYYLFIEFCALFTNPGHYNS